MSPKRSKLASNRLLSVPLLVALSGIPAFASDSAVQEPSPRSNPWFAAGLTYIPTVPASCAAAFSTGGFRPETAAFAVMNPMPGLGHLYVGEPLRGLGFLATNLAFLGGAILANVSLYPCRACGDNQIVQTRDRINLGYFVLSSALSAWAAWDAFRLAEEKNRAQSPPNNR